jgi:hypothetical protein
MQDQVLTQHCFITHLQFEAAAGPSHPYGLHPSRLDGPPPHGSYFPSATLVDMTDVPASINAPPQYIDTEEDESIEALSSTGLHDAAHGSWRGVSSGHGGGRHSLPEPQQVGSGSPQAGQPEPTSSTSGGKGQAVQLAPLPSVQDGIRQFVQVRVGGGVRVGRGGACMTNADVRGAVKALPVEQRRVA